MVKFDLFLFKIRVQTVGPLANRANVQPYVICNFVADVINYRVKERRKRKVWRTIKTYLLVPERCWWWTDATRISLLPGCWQRRNHRDGNENAAVSWWPSVSPSKVREDRNLCKSFHAENVAKSADGFSRLSIWYPARWTISRNLGNGRSSESRMVYTVDETNKTPCKARKESQESWEFPLKVDTKMGGKDKIVSMISAAISSLTSVHEIKIGIPRSILHVEQKTWNRGSWWRV